VARSLDQRIADAWPAAETEADGWQYRWTYGLTRRANSALAFAAELPVERVAHAEAFYNARGAVPRVLLSTALGTGDLPQVLACRGYTPAHRTLVMTAETTTVLTATEEVWPVATSLSPTDVWFDTYWTMEAERGRSPQDAVVYRSVLLAPSLPTVFALATIRSAPVGTGQLVIDEGWAGIQCMATCPGHRQRGAGTAVLHALARSASAADVQKLYLAVMASNTAAHHLYERAGFGTAHEYSYWSAE
jgi:ribosomal protein S18 acetylase RimI-like enzyme